MAGKEALMRGEPLCRRHGRAVFVRHGRAVFVRGGSEPDQGWSAEPCSCLSSHRGLAGDGAACVQKRGATPALGGTAPPLFRNCPACVSE